MEGGSIIGVINIKSNLINYTFNNTLKFSIGKIYIKNITLSFKFLLIIIIC